MVVGACVFWLGIVVAGTQFPGYSHATQMISELGGQDATSPAIMNTAFVAFGLTVVGLAVGLSLQAGRVFLGAVLVGLLGLLGAVAEGLVHCDSGCKGATTAGALHLGLGLVGFVSGVTALFVLRRRWRGDAGWSGLRPFLRVTAWASLLTLLAFLASNGFPSVAGVVQRLFAASLSVGVGGIGWWLASGRPFRGTVAVADPERASHPAPH